MMKFEDLVLREPKLDSLHGNCGLDAYSLIVDKEAVENEYEKDRIQAVLKITGESKIYSVDKGCSALDRLFRDPAVEKEDVGGLEKITFEFGVNIYRNPSGSWSDIYMNVKRVVLPRLKKMEVNTKARLYIVSDEGENLYKLPSLIYPKTVADLRLMSKYLKKKKKIKFVFNHVWYKDIKLEEFTTWEPIHSIWWSVSGGYIPQNIQEEGDIISYNNRIKTPEYKKLLKGFDKLSSFCAFSSLPTADLPLIDVNITQTDVNDFIKEQNDRFKIEK